MSIFKVSELPNNRNRKAYFVIDDFTEFNRNRKTVIDYESIRLIDLTDSELSALVVVVLGVRSHMKSKVGRFWEEGLKISGRSLDP